MQAASRGPTRVEAVKGFYANVQGVFGVVNPGDVVDLDRDTASIVAANGKATYVEPSRPLRRQASYLPERKRNPSPSQVDLLASLVKATEANTAAIQALVASQAKSDKGGK
jgi:hypothetical protein